jgi:RimJ/RimL family protein N-acetyltransferase
MTLIDFIPSHLWLLERAGGREYFGASPFVDGFADLLKGGWTAFADGQIIAIGGLSEDHAQCATAWSFLLPSTARHMIALTRFSAGVFDRAPYARLQAHALPTFEPAIRWLGMLGFTREGLLRKYSPSGEDMLLFARIRS